MEVYVPERATTSQVVSVVKIMAQKKRTSFPDLTDVLVVMPERVPPSNELILDEVIATLVRDGFWPKLEGRALVVSV